MFAQRGVKAVSKANGGERRVVSSVSLSLATWSWLERQAADAEQTLSAWLEGLLAAQRQAQEQGGSYGTDSEK